MHDDVAAAPESAGAAAVADGVSHPLARGWVTARRITNLVWLLVLGGASAGAAFLLSHETALPAALLWGGAATLIALGAALLFTWPVVWWRRASYRLDAEGLEIRRGVLWRSIIDVRRSRIQHSDVSQGPFERWFRLGTLRLHTAGTAHSRIQLRGLPHERALAMREFLMQTSSDDVV